MFNPDKGPSSPERLPTVVIKRMLNYFVAYCQGEEGTKFSGATRAEALGKLVWKNRHRCNIDHIMVDQIERDKFEAISMNGGEAYMGNSKEEALGLWLMSKESDLDFVEK